MKEFKPYEFDKIPEFAMQPAREDIDDFDPSIYERLLAGLEMEKVEADTAQKTIETPELSETPIAGAPPTPSDASITPAGTTPEPERASDPQSAPEPERASEPESAPMADTSDANQDVGGKTVIPAGSDVVTEGLRLVDMVTCEPVRIYVEEDILVPDVKPDLASILAMDGTLQFTERDRKVSGELRLQTLYAPQGKGADRRIVAIESRIPFQQSGTLGQSSDSSQSGTLRESGTPRETRSAAEDEADIVGIKASAAIESLDYSVINERKFRVKAVIAAAGREYRSRRMELFQGLRTDDVQMLKENITVTDVILRKSERLELEEDLVLPDALPEIGSVLRCDVNLVENHKQISREKAVISGTAYCNIMYLPKEEGGRTDDGRNIGAAGEGQSGRTGDGKGGRGSEALDGIGNSDGIRSQEKMPVLFQGKCEFTQFIALGAAGQTEQPTGGRAFFQKRGAAAEPRESESGQRNILHLNLDAETFVELYRDVEQSIVTDAYHHQKEMAFDRREVSLMQLCPGGMAETTVREVVNVPDAYEGVERIAFLSGSLAKVTSRVEGNKNVVEGMVVAKLVCLADDETATPFSLRREIPFRMAMDLPGGMENAVPDNEVLLKELRYDRLNNRQIELNASVMVNSAVISRKQCPLIRSVGFVEGGGPEREMPGLVLYITRSGDTLWKIAKRYRTTIDTVARINGMELGAPLKPGAKLLIVK